MKYIYIIATGAAKRINREKVLWDALAAAGLPVRDIHELPHIALHDIDVSDAAVAKLIKKRLEKTEKKVKLICLIASENVIRERLIGLPQEYVVKAMKDTQLLALQEADFCVPADELEVAARIIINIITDIENGS